MGHLILSNNNDDNKMIESIFTEGIKNLFKNKKRLKCT
jgi:hypothetical protein